MPAQDLRNKQKIGNVNYDTTTQQFLRMAKQQHKERRMGLSTARGRNGTFRASWNDVVCSDVESNGSNEAGVALIGV